MCRCAPRRRSAILPLRQRRAGIRTPRTHDRLRRPRSCRPQQPEAPGELPPLTEHGSNSRNNGRSPRLHPPTIPLVSVFYERNAAGRCRVASLTRVSDGCEAATCLPTEWLPGEEHVLEDSRERPTFLPTFLCCAQRGLGSRAHQG